MPKHHIPDLRSIQDLPNTEIRFYAAIGAAISLAAGLELRFLDIFQEATGQDREPAAREFFRKKQSKREVADEAMQHKLQNDPILLGTWKDISRRIFAATGKRGARNLVGHVAATKISRSSGGAIGGPIGTPIGGTIVEESYAVEQVKDQILAGQRDYRKEDFDSLLAYSTALISLLDDIHEFLKKL